jgi:glutathione S-transferase
MQASAWVSLAAMLLYIWIIIQAGRARVQYQVKAPSMDGPPAFLAAQRVQANTVEHLVIFFPALWLCAFYWQDRWAAALGAVWVIGRLLYALGYYRDPDKRGPGFMIGVSATVGLMIGTAWGLLRHQVGA